MTFHLFGDKTEKLSAEALRDLVLKLLLQMAWVDGKADAKEVEAVARTIERVYMLDPATVHSKINDFDQQSEDDIDTLAGKLRDNLPVRERVQLLRDIWSVARTNGKTDRDEQAYFYRVAELLDIEDNEFLEKCIKVDSH
ncbi:TerB family tellurite resistance protein [Mariprofundus ferrooxydans]|uniref:tellurite resistance TerB family protein n=1 Tax=Mariprofundus ferrooxydans TaxID=314344 RepID=UPI001431DFE7|nr:TerB family tellurite resistance protein [Mariprofundus ferrooxydans]